MKKIISLIVTVFLLSTVVYAKEKATLQMNWFMQGDHSGFLQAQLDNAHHDDVEITVKSGGPRIRVITQVASGQVGFGLANSDDLMIARSKGAPVKAIFVSLDHAPYNLVYHPNTGVNNVKDLNGRTMAVVLGITYWQWVKHTFGLDNVKEIPLTGDLGLFARTPNMFQQGYSIFLPARMDAKGIPNAQFKVADLGYKPYMILLTTEKIINEKPELVQAVINRVKMGWQKFMIDPAPSRKVALGGNKSITRPIHDNAVDLMMKDFLPSDLNKVGCQDPARWEELANQMKTIKALPADFDPHQSYDLSFVKGC